MDDGKSNDECPDELSGTSQNSMPAFARDFFRRLQEECIPQIEKHTVPFYGVQDDEIKHDRSGVLYKIGRHHFVLTASHDLKEIVENNIPLYVDRMDDKSLPIPLGEATFSGTEKNGRDVAVVKIPEDVVEKLLETKEFLTHSDITLKDDRENACYVLFGYPMDWSGIPAENSLLAIPGPVRNLVSASRNW